MVIRMNREIIAPIIYAHVTPTPKSINIPAIRNIVNGINATHSRTNAAVPIAYNNLFIFITLFLEIHYRHSEDNSPAVS